MYNRYVPQPDGSYRRNRVQDPQRAAPPPAQQTIPPEVSGNSPVAQAFANTAQHFSGGRQPQRRSSPPASTSAGSFLRRLLPGNLETEDLLVIVLLLLMAGDCEEERSNALLTLALYLLL